MRCSMRHSQSRARLSSRARGFTSHARALLQLGGAFQIHMRQPLQALTQACQPHRQMEPIELQQQVPWEGLLGCRTASEALCALVRPITAPCRVVLSPSLTLRVGG